MSLKLGIVELNQPRASILPFIGGFLRQSDDEFDGSGRVG